ncbi:GL17278 [Drosophila persimilis]|uniref:Larval serum protein 2 n=2 Tax=pseudoobscura subgroup TaxID=32358 RepID=A0A6I8V4W0_DROPS|nr:larval serum protein 2 [Drosophila persimilis]XP_002138869.1 larval serum protein 2 [Drosophila pseudoobscura]EDW35449.1 GL17278 [Drosophila persimilis]
MKSFTAIAVISVALLALGCHAKHIESKVADKDFLGKQKFVFDMLQHIYQDDVFVSEYPATYAEYKPWDHVGDYHHPELLEHFFELWQHHPFHDDQVWSVMYERHEEYAVGLVRLFYFAKNWETFQHAVFWARQHVNKQLFVYAFTVVTIARDDMQGIILPAHYEIHPWSFFGGQTLEMAEHYKMHGFHHVKKMDNIYNVVLKSNYSNHYGNLNYDHELAYFLEDVGFNSFYYYYNLDYPFWTKGSEHHVLNKDRRGELYLYTHWQLLARWYLERLSNDMGEVPTFNMYEPVASGYYSALRSYNGVPDWHRDNHHSFYHEHNIEHIQEVELYTQRVMDWIHKNEKFDVEVINQLGNIIQGNADSIDKKFYGSLDKEYRHIVNGGHQVGKHYESFPGRFMHYDTSLRDPLFYEVYKNLVGHYWHLMETFPEYKKHDYEFEGVKIDAVHMPESLTTYFEYFDADISNAVNVEPVVQDSHDSLYSFGRNSHYNGVSYVIKARQHRLNHKPFEFTLDVSADKAQDAIVKVFIGPKYDEHGHVIPLEHNYQNFFELDHFKVHLDAGVTHIKRNSGDFFIWVNDRTTYLELYQKLMDASVSDYKFKLDQSEAHCGVPNRMMLPKGKKGGQVYQFFYMVYPFHETAVAQYTGYDPIISCGIGHGSRYVDALPFGFPFNRPVKHDYYFDVHNFKFFDVKIFHRDEHTNVA